MNYVFKADEQTIARIVNSFDRECFTDGVPYTRYAIRYDSCNINIYTSNKVMFQGENARIYAATFFGLEAVEAQENKEDKPANTFPQAGSDEVGTGDYFGPICVCACYIDDAVYRKIKHLNLIDSKQLSDRDILAMGEELIRNVPHSLLILNNEKYNTVHKNANLNKIKALMHNKAYCNLRKKGIKLPEKIIIDQFCEERTYYRYLTDEKEVIRNITFETKAENKYVSVACGALISRYAFLKEMEAMGEKYHLTFPKGAGKQVDEFIKTFVRKYSVSELEKVAKTDYKNTEKALGE